jgi:hypothetical protein
MAMNSMFISQKAYLFTRGGHTLQNRYHRSKHPEKGGLHGRGGIAESAAFW